MSRLPGLVRLRDVTVRVRRALLAILGASAGFVGFWAACAPHSWFVAFPGLGMRWLARLGPYDEHLARDVGDLYLALFVLSIGAFARPRDSYLVRLSGGAWTVFSAPHLAFHLAHLSMYGTRDAILNVITLGGTLGCALGLLLLPCAEGGR